MSVLAKLSALVLTEAIDRAGQVVGVGSAGRPVVAFLQHLTDHSQTLPAALRAATDRAWTALEVALAGDTLWQRCTATLASAEDRSFRRQVRAFLDANVLAGDGDRREALAQLRAARAAGVLAGAAMDATAVSGQVADFARFADPADLLAAEWRAADGLGDSLQADYPALARVVSARPVDGMPVLVVAARYFFRRKVEADPELFRGLAVAQLDRLSAAQEEGYAALDAALAEQGDRLHALLADVREIVAETHGAVLDLQAQVEGQSDQVRQIAHAVEKLLDQHQLARRELRPGDSLSIRGDHERQLVREVVARYRALPEGDRQGVPALLNAVGKLQVVAGDFDAAQKDFQAVAAMERDVKAKAEAHHNAYRAALERRDWPGAVQELVRAVHADPKRFAPFPTGKYQPVRILGAGGFGVAFLCKHKLMDARVVIKTLLLDDLGRDADQVFTEAQVLRQLDHPAVIRLTDCGYVDAAKKSRPFLVMDYFEGGTLEEHVKAHGPLPAADLVAVAGLVAEGLHAAHEKGILHRDVKPANLLVRKDGAKWKAKVIDFGLALRQKVTQKSMNASTGTRGKTLVGDSIAGTLDYGPPEQMGKRADPVGPYSDIYGWAKTCCYALFQTTQPTLRHWQSVPPPLADLLGRCLEEDPKRRPQSFAEVLTALDHGAGTPAPAPPAARPATTDADLFGPVTEEPEETVRPTKRPAKSGRRPLLIGGVAVAVLAFVVAVAIASGMLRSKSPPAQAQGPSQESKPAAVTSSTVPAPVAQKSEDSPPDSAGTGWTPLFNGKDLAGWTVVGTSKGDWKVAAGAVSFVGGVNDKHTRHLVSDRADYGDVHIRFEASINDGGHGHFCFRATPKGDTVDGYAVQINSTLTWCADKTGSLFTMVGGRYGQLLSSVPKTSTRPGVWVPMEIIARGNHIAVTVEGKQVVDYTDAKNTYRTGSIILLQPTTDDKADIRFRNLEVNDLSPPTPRVGTGVEERLVSAGDATRLQGEWVCTYEASGGKADSKADLEAMGKTLTVKGNRFTIRRAKDGVTGAYDGEFELTSTTNPKRFDFTGSFAATGKPGSPVWFRGVYELSDNEFQFCYRRATTAAGKEDRPGDFGTKPGASLIFNKFNRVSPSPAKVERRWTPLFDGTSLTGWKVGAGNQTWKVVDGILTGNGPAGLLVSVGGDFKDFHLRAEVKINDGGNSGIFFRIPPTTVFSEGYEADINSTHKSRLKTGSVYRVGKPAVTLLQSPVGPGQWFTYEIIVVGNHITLKVDGKTVTDFIDPSPIAGPGNIALQQHNPETVVQFRKIEVAEPAK